MSIYHIKPHNAAYTLLELSLVLTVLSLLIAGIIAVVTQSTRRNAMLEVKRKMDVIEFALLNFRVANGCLPCPADSSLPITSSNFGIEGGFSVNGPMCGNTCTNGSTYTNYSDLSSDGGSSVAPDATFSDGAHTVAGDVPVATLGLSDDYMFDPWGGRFFYAVDQRMTAVSAFTNYTATATTVGSITINDNTGNAKIPTAALPNAYAIAVFMSYGPDGHGAFTLNGVRKNVGNSNANTAINCHCGPGNVAAATANFPTFIQAPATSTSSNDPASFDDIVRFYTRGSFLNSADVTAAR